MPSYCTRRHPDGPRVILPEEFATAINGNALVGCCDTCQEAVFAGDEYECCGEDAVVCRVCAKKVTHG